MSAVTAATAALQEPGIPVARLARVELRKLRDTRAGLWLLGILALLVVGLAVAQSLAGDADDHVLIEFLRTSQWPMNFILPVLAILAVTSEWSQRTALTTFTLVPDRRRVVAAKALAITAVGVLAVVLGVAVAAVATAAVGGEWELPVWQLWQALAIQLVALYGGLAFGLLLQSSAPAIVLYFLVPTFIAILVSVITSLEDLAPWVDLGQTTTPLLEEELSAKQWQRLGVSAGVWVLLPLLAGLWRLERSELK